MYEALKIVFSFRRNDRFEASSHVCESYLVRDRGDPEKNFTDGSIVDTLLDIAPAYNDTLYGFKWRNEVDVDAKLQKIITEEGVCYTFNDLNSKDIYTEECVAKLFLCVSLFMFYFTNLLGKKRDDDI